MTKVLLVEDDKSLREIYAVRLVEEGYDIVSAGDGEEALAMAIKDRPNLIISDVMMPKISGFDMLDILRSTTETKDIKVIMMTALSSEDQRQRGVSLGADRYLVKSQVGIEDVVRTVHEVLGDAPVAGQTPLMSATQPTPIPTAAPVAVPSPSPAPIITPGLGAQPSAPAAPVASAPIPPVAAQTPVTPPAPVTPAPRTAPPINPVATPAPATPNASTQLPEPTAPFSTPRTTGATLAGRVIEPLPTSEKTEAASMSTLMEKELSSTPAADATPASPVAPAPSAPSTPIATPPAPPVPPIPAVPLEPKADLNFEETPRPAPTPQANATPQSPVGPGAV